MTNINSNQVCDNIIARMTEADKNELLKTYMINELDKKIFEIKKNYTKSVYNWTKFESDFQERLMKKIFSVRCKIAYQQMNSNANASVEKEVVKETVTTEKVSTKK